MRDLVYEGMAQHEGVHWWFVGRRRILEKALETLALPANARVLEVGAGTGGNIALLQRFGTVSAVEPNPRAQHWLAAKTGLAAIDCTLPDTTPLRGMQFDLIAMFDVLEHIEDAVGALATLASHLSVGGRFLLTVPAHPFLWSAHDESLHHFRRYNRKTLSSTANAAGLKIIQLRYFNTLLFPAVVAARAVLNLLSLQAVDEERVPPPPLNAVLAAVLTAERHFVLRCPMPFGVSLLAVLAPQEMA